MVYTGCMNTSSLQPYLHFNGNCEEAMKFYQSVLGGELSISRFSDFGGPDSSVPQDKPEGVMHSTLTGSELEFMASDGMPEKAVVIGDNISLSITGSDTEQLTSYFNSLSEGGEVTLPLAKQVWGDEFGMCTDKYGIHWMINISAAQPAAEQS